MRSSQEPVLVDGPDHLHAFTGIPLDRRPAHGASRCPLCKGHGAWNSLIHLDTGRCIIKPCGECDGSGWISGDGNRYIDDIVLVDGRPAWTIRIEPRSIKHYEAERI